jgi:hypothetical protein
MPSLWCLPTRFLRGPSAAAAIAPINTVGSCGGIFGLSLMGFFRTPRSGDSGAFYALATLSLIGRIASSRYADSEPSSQQRSHRPRRSSFLPEGCAPQNAANGRNYRL